jgi:hypothetical protein
LEQGVKVIRHGRRSYPIIEMASGRFLQRFYLELSDVCFNPGELWEVLPFSSRTEASLTLGFCMAMRIAGGVSFTVAWVYDAYPFRLWMLIDLDLDIDVVINMLMQDCQQMWDEFTIQFRARFPSKEGLRSQECRFILLSIGIFFRIHMGRVENRHALLRRMILDRGSTWLVELMSIASDWCLHWARKWENDCWEASLHAIRCSVFDKVVFPPEPSPEKPESKPSTSSRGGGGRWKAFSSRWLRGNPRLAG